jgi:hypothetical protein
VYFDDNQDVKIDGKSTKMYTPLAYKKKFLSSAYKKEENTEKNNLKYVVFEPTIV